MCVCACVRACVCVYVAACTYVQNKLQNATLESEELSRYITKRRETLVKVQEETQRVEKVSQRS